MTTQRMLTAMILSLILIVLGLAKAQFNFTTIDVTCPNDPTRMITSTAAHGNSAYEIAGEFDDEDGTHGFVLSKDGFTPIDVPVEDAVLTSVNGISANGSLVGTYRVGDQFRAFFWSKVGFNTLNPPNSIRSQGGFLNAKS